MRDSINVYWNGRIVDNNNNIIFNDLIFSPPKPLYQYLKQTPNKFFTSGYFQCPAAGKHLKNVYIIESPVDFTLKINNNNKEEPIVFHCSINMLKVKDLSNFFFSLSNFYTFFTEEKNLEIEQINPRFHNTEFSKNTTIAEASFNIGKWFRGIHPNFISYKSEIKVKKGEPLYYIKFNTSKKIKFKNFSLNDNLIQFENNLVSYKHIISKTPLSKLYSLFMAKKYNKRILKEIKKNLTNY